MMNPGRILVQWFAGGVSVELELLDPSDGTLKASAELTLTPDAADRVAAELKAHAARARDAKEAAIIASWTGPACRHTNLILGRCVRCGVEVGPNG